MFKVYLVKVGSQYTTINAEVKGNAMKIGCYIFPLSEMQKWFRLLGFTEFRELPTKAEELSTK